MRYCFAFALFVVLLSAPALAGSSLNPTRSLEPRLEITRIDELSRIEVLLPSPAEADARRVLLRETPAEAEARVSGGAPDGATAFVTWFEAGERWSSWTRDAGQTWSAAAPVRSSLRLRDGAVAWGARLPAVPAELAARPEGRVFLVQFETISLPAYRDALASLGGEVLAYMPFNAHLVRMPSAAAASSLGGLDFVARVERYQPAYRLQPEIRDWLDAPGDPSEARRVRVMAFEWGEAGKARIRESALAMGAGVAAWWPSGHIIELELTRSQARELAHHDDVKWMDFWTPPETDMDLVREDAGTNWIETNFGYCGQGVRGEVLDSGVQQDHPDFDGILLHGSNSTSSHGTSTFGIVFGNGDRDGDGDAKGTGHMPCAEQGIFADYDFLGDRFAHTQELKNSPYFASFQTNSWGDGRTRAYTSVSSQMDDIIWRLDIAILQSQSNAGNQDSRPQAWAKNIISVGGVRHKDTLDEADDEWANGASIGPAADGRIKPDINYWYDSIYTTTTGSGYTSSFGGTSGATPESAGVLGLMLQMWSENAWGTNPVGSTVFERQPHASTLKALMINNAKQYDFSGQSDDLTRVHQGWGRPNAQIAYERAADSFIVDETERLEVGESYVVDVTVQPGETELKITMVYPDPPGTTSASLHRINDLSLKVTAPNGTVFWGNNGLLESPYSSAGGVANTKDTVENVFIANPSEGDWTVEVIADEINQDAVTSTPESDATFGLVVTGASFSVCEEALVDFTATPNPAGVGETVFFDSTVSGGGGEPYQYAWDFNGDGVTDSTEADPSYTYAAPYQGPVVLSVSDAADCATDVEKPMTVNGPYPQFLSYDLVELQGNGNGSVDPGEVFDLAVTIENAGNETGNGVTADIALSPTSAGPVSVLSGAATFGDLAPGATAGASPSYRIQVGQSFPCGNVIEIDLVNVRTASPANLFPDERRVIRILVGGAGPEELFFDDGFETPIGWTAGSGSEWELGTPQGLGGSVGSPGFQPKPDPKVAYEGARVAGTDLAGIGTPPGNYPNSRVARFTSPVIDASERVLVRMDYAHWLNVMPQDRAYLEWSTDGLVWTPLFEVSTGQVQGSWQVDGYDLTNIADREGGLRLRFGIDSDESVSASGWNIDAIRLYGVSSNSCVDFGRSSPGASAGLSVTKGAPGQLDLGWSADCAGASSYAVYRGDLALGLESAVPADGLCDVSSTSASISEGTGSAEFFLAVPNDGAFDGSWGTDSSGTRRSAGSGACHPQDTLDACAP